LTIDEKFKRIAEAKPWTGEETINIDLLTGRLRHIVACIHEDATASKEELVSLKEVDPERAKAIAQEIELIASEIERGRGVKESSIEIFEEIIDALPNSLLGRALDLFFYRVAYFTMTRLLLARAWEDIGFIDQSLYDGGLAKWHENSNREIRRVLRYAFGLAAERYKWLFNIYNNYTWYEPSDDTLIEVLYELSNFNLGKLNQDVLGTIYEEYIDKVDKRQKGQYYTPREIIEFIWNRVGFINPKAFFWHIKGERQPKFIFDPATGSGGFLVEAARRIRDESGINWDDFQDLLDVRTAILAHVFGSEISIFPYYITEVNLLIQLTPVIKGMMDMKKGFMGKGTPALGIVPVDTLSLYNPEQLTLEQEEYNFDQTRDLLPIESQKMAVFQKINKSLDGKFSYCCANPPYIGEKGNKELFRSSLQRFPYWKEFYQGKMDYLYFFIILGLSKLHDPGKRVPGGKLGFITTAYWPVADGASKLRKYILDNAKIKEMIFFEDVKIFEYAKGQHNMVFILEKCAGKDREQERAENRIKIVRVLAKNQEIPEDSIRAKLSFLTKHIEKHIYRSEWQDKYIKVFWSGVRQGELSEGAWNLIQTKGEKEILSKIEANASPISKLCEIDCGVFSNADYLSKKHINLIPENKQHQFSIKEGDGIFVLKGDEVKLLLTDDPKKTIIKRTYKNSNIDNYFINIDQEIKYLLYIDNNFAPNKFPEITKHLEKFKEVLQARLERYGEKYPWWRLHRPHKKSIYEGQKIVTSRWGKQNLYAIQEGGFFENSDINLYIPRPDTKEALEYILGLLNSRLLNYWVKYKGRSEGVSRQLSLQEIPIRCIDFDNPNDVKLHNEIVDKVKLISEKMRELAVYSKYFEGPRLTRLKPQDPLPDINSEPIVQALLPEKRFSLRTYLDIKINYGRDFEEARFILNKVGKVDLTLYGPELKLTGKDRKVIIVGGSEELLQIISLILENHKNEPWSSIKELPLIPETVGDYENKKQEVIEKVVILRTEIQKIQSSIDAIVFDLYGVSESFGEIANK